MESKIDLHDLEGELLGFARVGAGDTGEVIGEVYGSTLDDRYGAIRYEPLNYTTEESEIFSPEGAQVGYVRLERLSEDVLGGEVYLFTETSEEPELILHLHYDPAAGQDVVIRRRARWGEQVAVLRSDDVAVDEQILIGGGAAFLLLAEGGPTA